MKENIHRPQHKIKFKTKVQLRKNCANKCENKHNVCFILFLFIFFIAEVVRLFGHDLNNDECLRYM